MAEYDPIRERLASSRAAASGREGKAIYDDVVMVYDESKQRFDDLDERKLNKNRPALWAVATFATGVLIWIGGWTASLFLGGGQP